MAQTTKTSATDEGQVEASQVLAQYLELFSYDCNQFKFYLNANSVVDWFGRSVRGAAKIHDYLSKEVCSQYEHVEFEKVELCGPIEHRPTHLKTKIASIVQLDHIHPRNRVTGITSLKTYADSDIEEDDGDDGNFEITPLMAAGNKTPEKQKLNNTVIEVLTPPASTIKPEEEDDDEQISASESKDDDEDEIMVTKAKRLKRTPRHTPQFSYLRRLPTGRKVIRPNDDDSSNSSSSSSSSSSIDSGTDLKKITKTLAYTPLRYLEATGVLRRRAQSKATTVPTSPAAGNWDREVRIRISYRRSVHDKCLEFALVIYEHLSATRTPTRRNLIAELSSAAASNADPLASDDGHLDDEEVKDAHEQSALVFSSEEEQTVATVASTNTADIAAALETAAFTIVPLRTPTKMLQTPPATPKRKQRLPMATPTRSSGLKRLNMLPSTSTTPPTPKRSAARSLRL